LFLFTHLLFSFDHLLLAISPLQVSSLQIAVTPKAIGYLLSAIRYGLGGDSRRIHNDPPIRNPQMSLCDRRNIETVSGHHQSSHLVLRNRPKNLE